MHRVIGTKKESGTAGYRPLQLGAWPAPRNTPPPTWVTVLNFIALGQRCIDKTCSYVAEHAYQNRKKLQLATCVAGGDGCKRKFATCSGQLESRAQMVRLVLEDCAAADKGPPCDKGARRRSSVGGTLAVPPCIAPNSTRRSTQSVIANLIRSHLAGAARRHCSAPRTQSRPAAQHHTCALAGPSRKSLPSSSFTVRGQLRAGN